MPPFAQLRSQKPGTSESVSYDLSTAEFEIDVSVETGADGKAVGTAFIPGDVLCTAFGQPNADLLNLTEITVTGVSTSLPMSFGGSFHTGEAGTKQMSNLATVKRVHQISDTEMTAHHFIAPAASEPGVLTHVLPTQGLAHIPLDEVENYVDNTKTAIGRELRWASEMSAPVSQLTSTCSEVSTDDAASEARFLVPIDPGATGCAMSKLVNANRTNASFCDGVYHESKRSVTKDIDNRDCMVMTKGDFDVVSAQLKENLTTKSPYKNGLGLKLSANATGDVPAGSTVRVMTQMTRQRTSELFEKPDNAPGCTLNKAECHAFLGETEETAVASAPQGSADELAARVMAIPMGKAAANRSTFNSRAFIKTAVVALDSSDDEGGGAPLAVNDGAESDGEN
jgi:hypothetical protein